MSDDKPGFPCQLGPEDDDGECARSHVKNAKQTSHGVETRPPQGLTERKGSQESSQEGHSSDKAGDSHILAFSQGRTRRGMS